MDEKEKVNEEENKDKVIKVFKKTRKAFLIEYSCTLLLLIFLAYFSLKGITIKPIISKLTYSLAILSLISAELSRIMIRYTILPNKLTIIKGIIKHDKKNVYFHPLGFVPDLNVKQTRIQRMLSYGTIYLKGEGGNTFTIKDVSKPHKVLEMIEELIRKNR